MTEQEAVAALDALDIDDWSEAGEARIEAESILLSLVPDSVKLAYGRYVKREQEVRS